MIDFISHYHLFIIGSLSIICGFLVFYTFKFAMIVLKTEEKLTEILEVIDSEYNTIGKILETPVFFDSVEIRQVINSINNVRNSFLNISNYIIEDYKDDNTEIEAENKADN
jgi:hypothetical protein